MSQALNIFDYENKLLNNCVMINTSQSSNFGIVLKQKNNKFSSENFTILNKYELNLEKATAILYSNLLDTNFNW